jgi:uracil-DNA glycosylase
MKRTIYLSAIAIWVGLAAILALIFLIPSFLTLIGAALNPIILVFVIYTVTLISTFLFIFYLYEVGEAKDIPFFSQSFGLESGKSKPRLEVLTDLERAEYNIKKPQMQPRNVLKDRQIDKGMDLSKEVSIDPIKDLVARKKAQLNQSNTKSVDPINKKLINKIPLKTKEKEITLEVSNYESELIKEIKKEDNLQKVNKQMAEEKLFSFTFMAKNKISLESSWRNVLSKIVEEPRFKKLAAKLDKAYKSKKVYPDREDIFKAFELTPFDEIKVVIIGKIPFYRQNQADGLAFSSKLGSEINQTSQIIINEAIKDVNIYRPDSASLVNWAKQGVLLLNSALTAPSDKPAGHLPDWQWFSNKVIDQIIKNKEPKVFILWGEHGEKFISKLQNSQHLVIKAPNPSPLSAANGFYGSKPFSKVNKFLEKNGYEKIDWNI